MESNNASSVTLIISLAPLLSGNLNDCQNVTDPTCAGGVAALTAYSRFYRAETDIGRLVIPRLDYQTAFVQMHPLSWAVNRYVYKYRYNWDVYWAFASLFAQHKDDSDAGSRDLTDLLTDDIRPLLSNVAVPAYNSWSEHLQSIYFHNETGLAIILISHNEQIFTTPRVQTAQGLLRFIARINKRAGCIPAQATPFEAYIAAQNLTTSPARCWIPVLMNLGLDPQGFQEVLDAITEFEYPPQVIIDVTGNNETYANMTRIKDTWVFSKSYREGSFVQHRLFLSPDQTQVLNVTVVDESMSEIPDQIKNDQQYASDIAFMRQLADEAATNDPVVGKSQEMPVVRNTPYTPCRGGECPAGNLFSDAIRWKANASVAFINSGGIRGEGWPEGNVRMSDLWNTLPFANTLCEATMSGLSLFRMFNFSTSIATFQGDYTPEGDRLMQVSGIRITYNTQLNNSRLISMEVWDEAMREYQRVERLKLYKVASSSWECSGFDAYPSLLGELLTVEGEQPAVISDELLQNIVGEYLTHIGVPYNTSVQGRLVNNTNAVTAMDWIESEDSCPSRTYWEAKYLTCFDCPSTSMVQFIEETLNVDGVSGEDVVASVKATVFNNENFTVSLLPKRIPEWLLWSLELDEEEPTLLESQKRHTFEFFASALQLAAGTAQATVSFAVQDGGSFPGCTSEDVSFQVIMRVAPQPELDKPEKIRIVGFLLMSLTCLLSIFLAIWVYVHRESRNVKARQPEFLIQLCGGAFVLALSILPLSIVDELSSWDARNKACMAFPWFVFLGFNSIMSSLCAKLWRINKIFNGVLRRQAVTTREASAAFGLIVASQLVILIVWTVVDPLKWEIRHVPNEEWNRFGSCTDTGKWGVASFGLSSVLSLLSLLLTASEAFKAKNISDEYSESRDLGFAVFTAGQIVIVAVPILILIADDQPDAKYLLETLIIFAICISGLVLIFGPMMWQFYNKPSDVSQGLDVPSAHSRRMTKVSGISASLRELMNRNEQSRAAMSLASVEESRAVVPSSVSIASVEESTTQLQLEGGSSTNSHKPSCTASRSRKCNPPSSGVLPVILDASIRSKEDDTS